MVSSDSQRKIASLMAAFRRGDHEAAGALVELFYPELKRLAAARMQGERSEHTWQPTVLVNELYLELIKVKDFSAASGSSEEKDEKSAFFGLAAHLMKRLLIHHARPLSRSAKKMEVSDAPAFQDDGGAGLRELEGLLNQLGQIDPKLRTIVELKVFEGLTTEEIADQLGCSVRTAARHWHFAQHWLKKRFS